MSKIITTKSESDCRDFFIFHRHRYALDILLHDYPLIECNNNNNNENPKFYLSSGLLSSPVPSDHEDNNNNNIFTNIAVTSANTTNTANTANTSFSNMSNIYNNTPRSVDSELQSPNNQYSPKRTLFIDNSISNNDYLSTSNNSTPNPLTISSESKRTRKLKNNYNTLKNERNAKQKKEKLYFDEYNNKLITASNLRVSKQIEMNFKVRVKYTFKNENQQQIPSILQSNNTIIKGPYEMKLIGPNAEEFRTLSTTTTTSQSSLLLSNNNNNNI